jgi:hypothetical protein
MLSLLMEVINMTNNSKDKIVLGLDLVFKHNDVKYCHYE